jgi:hypothetical protein
MAEIAAAEEEEVKEWFFLADTLLHF